MTKQLQKAILKHLESEVSRLRVAVFNAELQSKDPSNERWKDWLIKQVKASANKLKQAEKNLAEFKKLYTVK